MLILYCINVPIFYDILTYIIEYNRFNIERERVSEFVKCWRCIHDPCFSWNSRRKYRICYSFDFFYAHRNVNGVMAMSSICVESCSLEAMHDV